MTTNPQSDKDVDRIITDYACLLMNAGYEEAANYLLDAPKPDSYSRLTPRKSASEAVEALRILERDIEFSNNAGCLPKIDGTHIETIRKALTSEPVAGWMPIETAPKDGTMILICLPRMMNLIVRARYDRVHNYWLHDYEGEGGIVKPYFYHEGDLWQPLPAPPHTETERG